MRKSKEFVSIPVISIDKTPRAFTSFVPVILMDGEYDEAIGMSVGRSVKLAPLPNIDDALESARIACSTTDGAIGYTAQGVPNE